MSDGTIIKPEKDFTQEVDRQLPEAQELAKVSVTAWTSCLIMANTRARPIYKAPSISCWHLRSKLDRYVFLVIPYEEGNYSLVYPATQSSDLASTSRLLVAIITLCKDAGDWQLLNEQVVALSKKHGQLKQATTKMVQVAMGFLDEAPSMEAKMSLIETLRNVTEGKVH